MIEGKTRPTYKGLAVLALLMVTIMPLTLTAVANTSSLNRPITNLTSPAVERAAGDAAYWAKSYGGSAFDIGYSIQNTSDGGYIVAASTNSTGAGYDDFWVFKLNSTGGIVWQNTYGGSSFDDPSCVQQTADGGYIVAGTTFSFGVGSGDFWVLKLNTDGTIAWQKTYGGSGDDEAFSIQQTADSGYIVAGATNSFGTLGYDAWILKLYSNGSIEWQKTYGGSGDDVASSIQQTTNGTYIVAGATNSFSALGTDAWIFELNSTGGIMWQKTYGGSDYDGASSIEQTTDGGFIVAGITNSSSAGQDDFWVFKLNSTGSIVWQYTYGGSDYDDAYSVRQTSDGGYIVAGTTYSFGAGLGDFWVLKLDSTGGIVWQYAYGGSSDDEATSVQNTSDGGYVVTGATSSFGVGAYNVWVVKLEANGSITWGPGSSASTTKTTVTRMIPLTVTSNSTAIPVSSNAVPQNTNVSPQATSATVYEQSPLTIGGSSGIPSTLIDGAIVIIVLIIVLVFVFRRRARSRRPTGPVPGPAEERPVGRQAVICPNCGARNVPGAKYCKDCGSNLQK